MELAIELGVSTMDEAIQLLLEKEPKRCNVMDTIVHEPQSSPFDSRRREPASVAEHIEAALTSLVHGLLEQPSGEIARGGPDGGDESEHGLLGILLGHGQKISEEASLTCSAETTGQLS